MAEYEFSYWLQREVLQKRPVSEPWRTVGEFGVFRVPEIGRFGQSFDLGRDVWKAYDERRVPSLSQGRSRSV